jgi:hypothetical protein
MLTGKWVIADDGALVMQWTEQEHEQKVEQKREEISIAA